MVYYLLFFGLITSSPLNGQKALDIYLLKNDQTILPLQGLANSYLESKIYSFDETFDNTLSKYSIIYSIKEKKFIPEFKGDWFIQNLTDSVYIFGVDLVRSPRGIQTFLNQIPDSVQSVLCLWGDTLKMKTLRFPEHINAVVYSPQFNAEHVSALAQVVFGGQPVNKKLKTDINEQFLSGSGLQMEKIRLGYTDLETAGMDADLVRDSIFAIAQAAIQDSVFPGMQVLIAKDGNVVYHESFGFHTYDKIQEVKTTDIYDFASVTKVTAGLAAVMKLHSDEKFDLEQPLEYYAPAMARSNKGKIPLRQILAHNARLQSWIAYWTTAKRKNGKWKGRTVKPDSSKKYNVWLTDDMWLHNGYKKKIYKMIKKSPLNEEPGYVYSGLLFYLLPEIIEVQNNHPSFENYLKETFYQPLGAFSITHNPYQFYDLDRIIPTERDTFFRMTQLHGVVHDEGAAMMGGVSSNAGLFGSADDLAKLAQMYCNYGSYGGTQYISSSTLKEFASCQYCEEDNRRGLGFDRPLIEYDSTSHVAQSVSDESFGHSGYTGTFVWIDPTYDLVYIFFSNRVYPTRLNRKLYTQNIRPRIQQVIYDSFLKPQ